MTSSMRIRCFFVFPFLTLFCIFMHISIEQWGNYVVAAREGGESRENNQASITDAAGRCPNLGMNTGESCCDLGIKRGAGGVIPLIPGLFRV